MNRIKHKEGCRGDDCCGLCCTRIEDLAVTIGKNEILKDINIHIHCGELTAVIGPNGAGKSTLLKALLGEVKHEGKLKYLDAKGIHSGNPVIGYVPQHLDFDLSSPISVLDLFTCVRSKLPSWIARPSKMRTEVLESLERVKVPHLIDRRLGALSGGEMQRVLLALALNPVPDLLLLDEPVSGIDQNGMELFYNTVCQIRENYDLSIILVSHDLGLVKKYSDRVVLLNRTVLCNGSPEEVYRDEKFLKTFDISWMNMGGQFKDTSVDDKGEML